MMNEDANLTSKSVYAFVAWIATIVSYVMYVLWALMPDAVLQACGLTYYPTRFYAVAFPAYLLVTYFLFVLSYHGYCLLWTPSPEDMTTVRDHHAVFPGLSSAPAPPAGTPSTSSHFSVVSLSSNAGSTPASTLSPGHTVRTDRGHIPDPFDLDPRHVSKVIASAPNL